jgi:hypothetical protein
MRVNEPLEPIFNAVMCQPIENFADCPNEFEALLKEVKFL